MNDGGLLLMLLAACFVGLAIPVLRDIDRWERRRRRLQIVAGIVAGGHLANSSSSVMLQQIVASLGSIVTGSGVLSKKVVAQLQHTLRNAGMRRANGLALFVGAKLLLLITTPATALVLAQGLSITGWHRMFAVAASGIGGLLLPDFVLTKLRTRHLRGVDRGVADALDMLVICTGAGLSLESALTRVAGEIELAHPHLAQELVLTANEMRLNPDLRSALRNAGTRTGLESIRRLAVTLTQTLQYGTPVSQALRTLSAELRRETLMRFEARAARLPVLLTVPMILFILPCVFLVVGGPAAVQIIHLMRK